MNNRVTKFLLETNVITSDEIEIYQYGFDLIVKIIIHTFLILIIGFLFGHFLEMVSFLVTYAWLREYAGGYHARTSKGCYYCTILVTIFVLVMFFIFRQLNVGLICICMLISGIVISRASPQEAPTKPLSEKEKVIYRKKTRSILLCLAVIFGIGCVLSREVAVGIVCSWIVQMAMLFFGRYFAKKYTV